jgi:hypothetical protein
VDVITREKNDEHYMHLKNQSKALMEKLKKKEKKISNEIKMHLN